MMLNRIFKKTNVLDLSEGDTSNGTPDGPLNLDSPDFKVTGWTVDARGKTLQVHVLFTADQGTVNQKHSRTFNIDLTKIPAGARQRFIDQYDFITDNIVKAFPQLADGTEQ